MHTDYGLQFYKCYTLKKLPVYKNSLKQVLGRCDAHRLSYWYICAQTHLCVHTGFSLSLSSVQVQIYAAFKDWQKAGSFELSSVSQFISL